MTSKNVFPRCPYEMGEMMNCQKSSRPQVSLYITRERRPGDEAMRNLAGSSLETSSLARLFRTVAVYPTPSKKNPFSELYDIFGSCSRLSTLVPVISGAQNDGKRSKTTRPSAKVYQIPWFLYINGNHDFKLRILQILTQIDNDLQSVTFEGNLQAKTPPKSEV